MSATQLATGGPSRVDLQPVTQLVTIKYHSVSPSQLAGRTETGLLQAGVPASGLGRRGPDNRITLTGCVVLSEFARTCVPPSLGGTSTTFRASPATTACIGKALEATGRAPPGRGLELADLQSTPTRETPTSGPWRGAEDGTEVEAQSRAASPIRTVSAGGATTRGLPRYTRATSSLWSEQLARVEEGAPDWGEGMRSPRTPGVAAATWEAGDALPSATRRNPSPSVAETHRGPGLAAAAGPTRGGSPREGARRSEPDELLDSEMATLRRLLAALRGTAAPGGVDPSQSAVHTTAAVTSQAQVSEATAYLTSLRTRFPNIHRAMQKATDTEGLATLSDFPAPVLVAAVHAAKLQEHGLKVLLQSARHEAAPLGESGKAVVHALDRGFDYDAAELIELGTVDLDLQPLDLALGVIPLLQLALHIWYDGHRHTHATTSPLLAAAKAFKLHQGAVFDPRVGLRPLREEFAAALGSKDLVPTDAVYQALVKAITSEAVSTEAAATSAAIQAGRNRYGGTSSRYSSGTCTGNECTAHRRHSASQKTTYRG